MPIIPPVTPITPGVQLSGLDIVKKALGKINCYAAGDTLEAQDANDALVTLNVMLDSWNSEDLMIPGIEILNFSFIPSQQAYTLGPGGDWDHARPQTIEHLSLLGVQNPPQTVELPILMISDEEWADMPVKQVECNQPLYCYDDAGFPMRTLRFYGIPTVADQVAIYSWLPLAQFSSLQSVLTFQPAYYRAILYNLAVELSTDWNVEPTGIVVGMAVESKARVKASNITPIDMRCDDAVVGVSNFSPYRIWTGR